MDFLSKHHTFDISIPSDCSDRHSSPQTKARHCIYRAIKQLFKIWYTVPFCYSITLRVPVKLIYGLALLTVVCINLVCLQLQPLHTSATLK